MSRIIVKQLPNITTEKKLVDHFKVQGVITDSKLVYRNGTFRGFAFMGFESPDQAEAAVKAFNNTYFFNSKIIVEIAKNLNDASRPKSHKQLEKEKQELALKKKHERMLHKETARLRASGGNASVKASILEKCKDDPKFVQFLELNLRSDTNLLEDVKKCVEPTAETNDYSQDNTEDNEGIKDSSKPDKQKLSDLEYWRSMMSEIPDKPEEKNTEDIENEAPAHTGGSSSQQHKKSQKWKELYDVRLRIDKFPKKAKSCSSKNKSLSKSDIRSFFNPIKVSSIRKNQKNRFEYFIGFQSSSLMNQALKKDGGILLGVRVRVSALATEQKESTVQHNRGAAPWAEAAARLEQAEPVAESGRLFVRNLSYGISEGDIREKFSKFGEIVDLELPVCKKTGKLKGFATVSFLQPKSAVLAMNALDGTDLRGRVMHVLPALSQEQIDQNNPFKSLFKQKKSQEQKTTASSWHNWNTLFLSSTAVVEILAKKYNRDKEQILDNEGHQSAAVTVALGEAQIVDETRRFLEDNGVSVDAFSDPSVARSDTVMLVKHLPAGTKAFQIAELCAKYGELGRVIMPPSGLTCIVEFLSATEASNALSGLSYKRFGPLPLYLEYAPVKTFNTEAPTAKSAKVQATEQCSTAAQTKRKREDSDDENDTGPADVSKQPAPEPEQHTTLYVQNLAFDLTEDDIKKHFSTMGDVASVVLARKGNKSLGYGFVQYFKQRHARQALISLARSTLNGRDLDVRFSEKKLTPQVKSSRQVHDFGKQLSGKIAVKNIPFQATKKEVEQIFRPFGTLKRTFLQKHHSGEYNNGGYGFVEFISMEDAKRALDTLGLSTHFYGRRLVLQWAKADETVEELRHKTAQKHEFSKQIGAGHKKMRHAMLASSGKTEFDE